jgi:hypothetical protein
VLRQKKGIDMKAISELRIGERFTFEAPVSVEDNRRGYRYDGTMFNYSRGGMYLETDYAPRSNRKIMIKVDNLPSSPAPQSFHAEVRWRQPLPGRKSGYSFGLGVKYF